MNKSKSNNFFTLSVDFWNRNKAVFVPTKGAMRSWLCKDCNTQLLVILPDQRQAKEFYNDAKSLNIKESIYYLPEIPFIEDKFKIHAIRMSRGGILSRFRNTNGMLIATPTSLLAPFENTDYSFQLSVGQNIPRDTLIEWLIKNMYVQNDLVWSPGQYVVRGSIVDIYSPSEDYPLRVEYFDDEIVSLRQFLPETQKSIFYLENFYIRSLIPEINRVSLEKNFASNIHIIYFDPKEIEDSAENTLWLWKNLDSNLQKALPYLEWSFLSKKLSKYKRIRVVHDTNTISYKMPIKQFPLHKGKLKDLDKLIDSFVYEGYKISFFTRSELSKDWTQDKVYEHISKSISEGFIDPIEKIVLISDYELFGFNLIENTDYINAPRDWGAGLEPGQWVIHDDYGVAKYIGSKIVTTVDGEQEYLVLEYAEEQRLLVPVLYSYKISAWSPLPGQEPVLNSLKGSRWKRSSEKTFELAKKTAADLLKVYAEREIIKGHSFSINTELMKEIEGSFPYEETVDQRKAIEAVTIDMQASYPMDRLIVGDVGFGKTELAIRAIAISVFDGKQAVLMTPTTLLAQQHYETISSRFSNLPVIVRVISRFVPLPEQREIINDLKKGKVDVIIGTHRLLSEDIKFKDLGLVVIDEEHRFGVKHKEHLKKTAPYVDILMLSATPIPRSLSLSLSGLRDISLLQTPPQRRLPIITVVRPWSENLLINAVLREKNRGGQVFYVHNRINDIHEKAAKLKKLFPKLKIGIAHSKTPEVALEKTMSLFSSGEIDILVCTTIVESGLDIPNANTLIIDDTHELGLAQIYQLRGRVGRREEQAFAFLFYPVETALSTNAKERLEAIAELDELGAGYSLAQRDLQIRGAGDLLGVAQHGNAIKISHQKYYDLLSDEIEKIQGIYTSQVEVKILFPATIPTFYLPQEAQRVTLYRRLIKIKDPNEVVELKKETEDRFGNLPNSLKFLFDLAFVRCFAKEYGITKILCSREETIIYGEPEGKWEKLRYTGKWSKRLNGVISIGGYVGITSLCEIIKSDEI